MSIEHLGPNLIVCGSGPMEETARRPDGETRWCFKCRARRDFFQVIHSPTTEEGWWWGPVNSIRCGTCNKADGDCFPGTYREWED